MNTNQQPGDQNNAPGRVDPDRPDQQPDTVPAKDAPGHRQPIPGQPAQPDQNEPGRHTPPGKPGDVPQPKA